MVNAAMFFISPRIEAAKATAKHRVSKYFMENYAKTHGQTYIQSWINHYSGHIPTGIDGVPLNDEMSSSNVKDNSKDESKLKEDLWKDLKDGGYDNADSDVEATED